MSQPPHRHRAALPPGSYVIRLHLDGETASIALLEKPDEPIWVGPWAPAAVLLQDFDERTDHPEPLTWEVRVPVSVNFYSMT